MARRPARMAASSIICMVVSGQVWSQPTISVDAVAKPAVSSLEASDSGRPSVTETDSEDVRVDMAQWLETIKLAVEDQRSWPSPDTYEFRRLVFDGIAAYGLTNDGARVPALMRLYKYSCHEITPEDRKGILSGLATEVERGNLSVNTFMPFMLIDPDLGVASSAAILFAVEAPPMGGNPLTGPRTLIDYLEQNLPASPAGILGGAIALGDRRALDMLNDIKWKLPAPVVQDAARANTGMPTVGAFEFWLTWLEEMAERGLGDSSQFGSAASALARLVLTSDGHPFQEVERMFGRVKVDPDAPRLVLKELYTPEEMGQRYAERLYRLERSEPPPKVMSNVLPLYGLESRVPSAERAQVEH
jgi:hypothetical protein